MIPFFRKIRKRFADDNKPIKYMRYAIGEILLVVIGILIALQVNNWNEERKQKATVKIALESLKKDLVIQYELIEEQIEYETKIINEIDSVLIYINIQDKMQRINALCDSISGRHTFVTVMSSFKNLEDSGGLNHIKEQELQNSIVRYFQKLDYTSSVTNNNNLFLIDNQYGSFILQNPLYFAMKENGEIRFGKALTDEERYFVVSNINRRKTASESIAEITAILGSLTIELIDQITEYLE